LERKLETKTDLELIEAAFDGNVESFGELCSRYYTAMVALAHSKVNDKNLAEDIAQQTLKFYNGMTYEKISQVLGISSQAINGRLRRAKKMIAKRLKN